MRGELTINGNDAYETWGVSLGEGSVAELLTAPDVKDYVTNDCPNEDGIRVAIPQGLRFKQREVQLTIVMTCNGEEDYLSKYRSFVNELKKGVSEWVLSADATVKYRFIYSKMNSFAQIQFKIAKFVLNVVEPNPANRSL